MCPLCSVVQWLTRIQRFNRCNGKGHGTTTAPPGMITVPKRDITVCVMRHKLNFWCCRAGAFLIPISCSGCNCAKKQKTPKGCVGKPLSSLIPNSQLRKRTLKTQQLCVYRTSVRATTRHALQQLRCQPAKIKDYYKGLLSDTGNRWAKFAAQDVTYGNGQNSDAHDQARRWDLWHRSRL